MTSSFQSTTSGGGWGGPIAAIFTAMIAAVLLGPLLHWLEIALACLGIGAAITAGLVVRRRLREHQALTRGGMCRGCSRRSSASSSAPSSSRRLSRTAGSICTCTWMG